MSLKIWSYTNLVIHTVEVYIYIEVVPTVGKPIQVDLRSVELKYTRVVIGHH